jgi:hypothetical protein
MTKKWGILAGRDKQLWHLSFNCLNICRFCGEIYFGDNWQTDPLCIIGHNSGPKMSHTKTRRKKKGQGRARKCHITPSPPHDFTAVVHILLGKNKIE